MPDRLITWFGAALVLVVVVPQITSCAFDCSGCGELEPVESGEYVILNQFGQLDPEFEDLVGAQLIIDRDTETSVIRYTRDGTTYEVRHSLTKP